MNKYKKIRNNTYAKHMRIITNVMNKCYLGITEISNRIYKEKKSFHTQNIFEIFYLH